MHPARVLAALLIPAALHAQARVDVPGSEQFTMKSRTNGIEYRIDAWAPPGWDTLTVRPSLFVVTDGNLFFQLIQGTYQALALGGEVSPIVVVGVSYPETDGPGFTPGYAANRTRDLTPTNIAEMPGGGGGAAFLTFLKDELVPFAEKRWRTDPTSRGLGGHSLGGLFSTYALLHEPGLFSRVWIGSPSLWWDKQVAFSWVVPPSRLTSAPHGRAFVSVGANESDVMVPPMRRMTAQLTSTYPALHVGSQVFPDEGHGSVIVAAMSRALRYLYGNYGRPTVALAPAARAGWAGTWVSPARTVKIKPGATGLMLELTESGQTLAVPLQAASRDTMFSTGIAAEFVANRDASGRVTSLTGNLLGLKLPFTRRP